MSRGKIYNAHQIPSAPNLFFQYPPYKLDSLFSYSFTYFVQQPEADENEKTTNTALMHLFLRLFPAPAPFVRDWAGLPREPAPWPCRPCQPQGLAWRWTLTATHRICYRLETQLRANITGMRDSILSLLRFLFPPSLYFLPPSFFR